MMSLHCAPCAHVPGLRLLWLSDKSQSPALFPHMEGFEWSHFHAGRDRQQTDFGNEISFSNHPKLMPCDQICSFLSVSPRTKNPSLIFQLNQPKSCPGPVLILLIQRSAHLAPHPTPYLLHSFQINK